MARRLVQTSAVVWLSLSTLTATACGTVHDSVHDHGSAELGHMAHEFDDVDQYAVIFDDPARDEWQLPTQVIDTLQVKDGETVADIGAGTGYFTIRLAELTPARRVYAVDVEPGMVEHVEARASDAGLVQVVGVLAAPDHANLPEPVDVILIVNTYHHIPDRVSYFTRLTESLNPGGRLAIVDYRKGAPGGGPPDHFRFTPDEITTELAEAGFELHSALDFLPRQHFLLYQTHPAPPDHD